MSKFRLESYSGKSMEFGKNGADGVRGSEERRDDSSESLEEERLKVKEALAWVPGDDDKEIEEPIYDFEKFAASASASVLGGSDEDYEKFMDEIIGSYNHPYAGSMNISDMAQQITKAPDAPTYKDVCDVDKELFQEELDKNYEKDTEIDI